MQTQPPQLRSIRFCIAFVIVGLFLSGITAFPLLHEMRWIARMLGIDASPAQFTGARYWVATILQGLEETDRKYPFLAYGTDWLAFAHLTLAVLFVGPWRDPVKNIWVIEFGIFACAAVIPLAIIAGHFRGLPIGWRLIDCSFGAIAIGPLWFSRTAVVRFSGKTP